MRARLKAELSVRRITSQRLFLFGAAKRTLAQAEGFRVMQDACNATVAASLVRLQLDTLLRLYALWWVTDADAFADEVFGGRPINRIKAADGQVMTDADLYRRLSDVIPWIRTVYQETSGFVHFSERHLLAVLQASDVGDDDGAFVLNVDPLDAERPSTYFNQLASSFTDVTMRIGSALNERFDLIAVNPDQGQTIAEVCKG